MDSQLPLAPQWRLFRCFLGPFTKAHSTAIVWPRMSLPEVKTGSGSHLVELANPTIQLFLGCERLLVSLVLHQGVTLEEASPPVQVQVDVLQGVVQVVKSYLFP